MTRTAFVFPGQGSQSLGMLADFADRPAVKQTFQEASGALGLDIWALCQEGPQDALNQTENTQPLLLTAGVALWRLWEQSGGPRPNLLAGHSLGEYTALTCAGVINLGDAVRLVRTRGQLMQQAVAEGEGKMAAVLGLDDDQDQDGQQGQRHGRAQPEADPLEAGRIPASSQARPRRGGVGLGGLVHRGSGPRAGQPVGLAENGAHGVPGGLAVAAVSQRSQRAAYTLEVARRQVVERQATVSQVTGCQFFLD